MLAPDHGGAGDAHLSQRNQPVLVAETGAGPGLPEQAACLLQLPLRLFPGPSAWRRRGAGGGWDGCLGCSLFSQHRRRGTPGISSELPAPGDGHWVQTQHPHLEHKKKKKERKTQSLVKTLWSQFSPQNNSILLFSATLIYTMANGKCVLVSLFIYLSRSDGNSESGAGSPMTEWFMVQIPSCPTLSWCFWVTHLKLDSFKCESFEINPLAAETTLLRMQSVKMSNQVKIPR